MFTQEHFFTAGISTLFYSCLNVIFTIRLKHPENLSPKDYRDYVGQHISLCHSILAVTISLTVFLNDGGIDYESDNSYKYILVLGHSMGYFTYDMIYAEIFGVHDTAMRFHHICVMIGGYMLYFQDKGGSVGCFCVMLTELSNPPMQIRLIYRGLKKENTLTYKISEFLFVAIFSFNRGLLGTFLNYNVYQYSINSVVKLFVSLIYGVSVYWVFIIMCMINKKIESLEKKNQYAEWFVKVMKTLKANKLYVTIGIFSWALIMPSLLLSLGTKPYHLEAYGVTLV